MITLTWIKFTISPPPYFFDLIANEIWEHSPAKHSTNDAYACADAGHN